MQAVYNQAGFEEALGLVCFFPPPEGQGTKRVCLALIPQLIGV